MLKDDMKTGVNEQVIVVTGGAQGLGKGIANMLSSMGATVVIADLQLDKAKDVAAEFSSSTKKAYAARLDVTSTVEVDQFFNEVEASHGRIDALVNSAGVGPVVAPIVELSDEEKSFKTRYGDVRRHLAAKEKEYNAKIKELEGKLGETEKLVPPTSDEELSKWIEKYPDVSSYF